MASIKRTIEKNEKFVGGSFLFFPPKGKIKAMKAEVVGKDEKRSRNGNRKSRRWE
ncbi:MAG: hypothetical protein KAT65_24595 [Methanophagales archaeon]|nr:hypothetical protein [Methanophagales archaeon]